jgi:nitronate monooxygenase
MRTLHPVFNKLRLPVIGSPLFIISNPKLVIAQCKAGIVGSMPALNARPASQLDEWLHEITESLAAHDKAHPDCPAAPFAINQIVHKSNDRLEQDMALCVKYKVPIVITSLGAREDINQAAHSYGGVVMHDIINNRFARKAIEKGADGLIAVAAGAGGHAGVKSPFALIAEVRQWFDGPVALSGLHKPWEPISPTSARPSSPRTRRAPVTSTSSASWRATATMWSTATCSLVCMATTWHPAFAGLAWILKTCRKVTRAK